MSDLTSRGIPDKAVEAAAQAIWNVPPVREGRASWEYWNENNPAGPEKLRKQARAALEAAEPYLTGGLRQELKDLRAYCAKYVDDSDATEEEQLAYDDVCISIAQILQRHPEVES